MAKAKKLPSGQWRTLVYDYTDSNGKRHYESFTAETKKESEYMAAEFAVSKKRKVKCDYTVEEAIDKYCEDKSNILSQSTIAGYKHMIKYYRSIENVQLSKLSQDNVQRWVNDLAKEHSPKTVRNAHCLLSAVLKTYKNDLVLTTALPQKVKPVYHIPSDQDISSIINYLREHDNEMLKAVCLASFATLRRSEICGLDASDLNGNILHVNKALVKTVDKTWEIKTTKTVSSDRYIEIPEEVVKMFPESGKVVNITPDAITHRFFHVLKKLDIQHFRFHDLRHYSASIMHAIGIPDQYIMQRGGWSSDSILKSVYRNTMSDYQKKYTDIANNHFRDVCNTKCNT